MVGLWSSRQTAKVYLLSSYDQRSYEGLIYYLQWKVSSFVKDGDKQLALLFLHRTFHIIVGFRSWKTSQTFMCYT